MAVDYQYLEVSCKRDVTLGNFGSGLQDYVFSVGRPNVYYPHKSYMRFQVAVSGAVGANTGTAVTKPTVQQQIALAEGCIANCYNNANFLAGGQSISQINSFFPQISAIEARTTHSGAWLDKIGSYVYGYNGDRSSRIAAISDTTAGGAACAAQVGIGLSEGKEAIYRPTDGKTPDAATVALTAATGAIVGVGTAFAATDVGSDLIIAGVRYRIITFTDATHVAVGTVSIGAIAATAEWYMTRRNLSHSTQARNTIQVLWKPSALGIFRSEKAMGAGNYSLQLNPDSNYQKTMIEYPYSSTTGYGPNTSSPYSVAILDAKLYVAMGKESIPSEPRLYPTLEFQCQQKNMNGANSNFQWTVPNSTITLYMFLQDTSAGSNPIIPPSVFRVYGTSTVNAATLPAAIGCEQNLEQIQITYANMTKPQTRWTSGFAASGDYLVQLFMQSLIETDRLNEGGGAETMDQWLQRGPLYCWRFDRDAADRSTEVQTQVTFNSTSPAWPTTTGANLFLCAEYEKVSEITTNDGVITNVRSLVV